MPPLPRICVLIPVYNHGLTVLEVARGAQARFPVLVVDDGSTDRTPALLRGEPGLRVLTHPRNFGKAAALRTGFERARELGFTHAITIDADGQHRVATLGAFEEAILAEPEAMIVGVRDFKRAAAPWIRRVMNEFSDCLFWLETGLRFGDSQCGYRAYPLRQPLEASAGRYGFELELLVKASWAGIKLVPLPVESDYAAPTSRLSHFHPFKDLARLAGVHLKLLLQAPWKRRRAPG